MHLALSHQKDSLLGQFLKSIGVAGSDAASPDDCRKLNSAGHAKSNTLQFFYTCRSQFLNNLVC